MMTQLVVDIWITNENTPSILLLHDLLPGNLDPAEELQEFVKHIRRDQGGLEVSVGQDLSKSHFVSAELREF